jgi:catechol 2,3-dioxygenase-like lactoylglutathione lyase family enzyme
MLRHLASVAEIVDDVPAAVAFYRDVLGLQVKDQMGDDYVVLVVPGLLHFGVWSRAHAAEAIYGDRGAAERVPLGYTLEFEVDDINQVPDRLKSGSRRLIQPPHQEPWNQTTCRGIAPGGGVIAFAVTPWARRLAQPPQATET